MPQKITDKITVYGNRKQITKAKEVLLQINSIEQLPEDNARLKIQEVIDKHQLTTTIMYNGNTVWSKDRIILNLKRIMKVGTLYNARQPKHIPIGSILRTAAVGGTILSKYFYNFLTGVCGSIAHTNIQGWIYHYPTLDYLKKFFKKNEFGVPVHDWIPWWYTDARAIVDEIERLLFPFQTYMQQKSTENSEN